MKKFWKIILALAAVVVLFVGCLCLYFSNTPKGYVRKGLFIMDHCGLYAGSDEWKEAKKDAIRRIQGIESFDQSHELLSSIIKIAGGKHSAFIPPINDTASFIELPSKAVFRPDSILYLEIPAHIGVKVSDSTYIHNVLDTLLKHLSPRGVVVDLQGNHGGNMYPMFAALLPLFPEENLLSFRGKRTFRNEFVNKEKIAMFMRLNKTDLETLDSSVPIAILVDNETASSGEAVLIGFRGLANVRSFGEATAGYASGNGIYPMKDGYKLVLTESEDIARTGESFCDDPIPPDIVTPTPLDDAIAWINEFQK